ncbi:DMT family transporter [Burkholderia gladioli]|uniref:DMT family transporter n=1 Tax=Burkholderia gladioli TaxID=28095 RepID=UPI0015E6FB86|nr:DMT family transporter [Burkholderia gladioli]MBA1363542.1 DMT family transporter [Burkholderia gladioli]
MNRHRGYHGLIYCSLVIISWSSISLLLKLANSIVGPVTMTWLRVVVAGAFMLVVQAKNGELKQFRTLIKADLFKMVVASLGLFGNYVFASWGVAYLTPEAAMLILQLAPIFFAIGGRIFLSELVTSKQWACFGMVVVGLLIFLHRTINGAWSGNAGVGGGVLIMIGSAISWSVFALLQKSVMQRISPSNVLCSSYIIAAVLLLPFKQVDIISRLDLNQVEIVMACCADTILAYWSFSQAQRYLETMKVSAILAMTPVAAFALTLLVVWARLWPGEIFASPIDFFTLLGIFVVLVSAILLQFVRASSKIEARDIVGPVRSS